MGGPDRGGQSHSEKRSVCLCGLVIAGERVSRKSGDSERSQGSVIIRWANNSAQICTRQAEQEITSVFCISLDST